MLEYIAYFHFDRVSITALGELECGRSDDPDNTPIWQAIVAHEAENATLRQELNKSEYISI